MKVLLLSHIFPSARKPTMGTFNQNVFRSIAGRCEVRVIAPQQWWTGMSSPREWLSPPRHDRFGVDTLYPLYWSVPKLTTLHGYALYASLRRHIAQMRREFRFDAILASWAYPDGFAAARLAKDLGCPFIIKALGSDINELAMRPALRSRIADALRAADHVVAVSHALRDKIVDIGVDPSRVTVLHNGVDGQRFKIRNRPEVRSALGLAAERKYVCYVGNIVPEKGTDILIEAMGVLKARGRDDIYLLMVGSGAIEGRLRSRAAELGISGRINFCGRRPHEEIPLWMSACDVFCLPSRREGCPNVVLESLASGRPVVASSVGGVPEILSVDNGALVPSGDPAGLADALERVLGLSWDADALRASVRSLSWDDVGRKYVELLNRALADHGTVPRQGMPKPVDCKPTSACP